MQGGIDGLTNKTRTNTIISQVSDIEEYRNETSLDLGLDMDIEDGDGDGGFYNRDALVAEKQAELDYAISQYIYASATPAMPYTYTDEEINNKMSNEGLSLSPQSYSDTISTTSTSNTISTSTSTSTAHKSRRSESE